MKNFHKKLILFALILAVGLGFGLRGARQGAGEDPADAEQSAIEWALRPRQEDASPAPQDETGPAPDPAAEPVTATLLVCGDAMAHSPQLNDAYDSATGEYDFTHMFRSVRDTIRAADYSIVNLETTLAGPEYTGYPTFSSPDSFAEALRDAGFDLMLTANNHCCDRRFAGLSRTLDVLDGLGVAHVGTYRTAEERARDNGVYLADVGGISVAFVGYTYGTNGIPLEDGKEFSVSLFNTDYMTDVCTPDTAQIEADLAAARALGPDLVCVLIHWGIEYDTTQSAYQEQVADLLIENGADIIFGGHSHVPQPMEWRTVTCADGTERTAFVLYSLGNFISSQKDRYTDTTAAVQLTLTRDETGETAVTGVAYEPFYRLRRDKSADEVFALLDVHKELAAYENGTGAVTQSEAEALYRCIDDCREIFGAQWKNQIAS